MSSAYLKNKNTQAFTIVELIVAVVIIGMLASLATFSYTLIQKESRDSARESQARIISDALESYYDKNGEYPSVALMTGSSLNEVNLIKARLNIADIQVLKFPGAPSRNSVRSNNPNTVRMAYEATTVVPADSNQCQSNVEGFCDNYVLRYVQEADGVTKVITGRYNK